LGVNAGRETFTWMGRSTLPLFRPIFETLGDHIKRHAYRDFELRKVFHEYRDEISYREEHFISHGYDVDRVLEGVYSAAYGSRTLGSPLTAHESNLKQFTETEFMTNYARRNFTADRLVIAGVGVQHEALVALAEQEFGDELEPTGATREAAKYTGGESLVDTRAASLKRKQSLPVQIALAFQTVPLSASSRDIAAVRVLTALLGGGDRLRAIPRGVAQNSRLAGVVNRHSFVRSLNSFSMLHSDSSLFGLLGSCASADAGRMTDIMAREAVAMASESVTDKALSRARAQARVTVLSALDRRAQLVDSLAISASHRGGRGGLSLKVEDQAADITQVSADDVKRVALHMLRTPLTLVAYGDLTHLPRFHQIEAHFK